MAWPPACYQRATAFVTDPAHRLLVFDHADDPTVATQVPAGGIKDGESPDEAVRRELAEESGLTDAKIVRKLGEAWFRARAGDVPAGYEEQVHHVFHLHLDLVPTSAAWVWEDCDGGTAVVHRYAFRWADLDTAAATLHPSLAMWIAAVRSSLEHPNQ